MPVIGMTPHLRVTAHMAGYILFCDGLGSCKKLNQHSVHFSDGRSRPYEPTFDGPGYTGMVGMSHRLVIVFMFMW